jgi:hypothetical protein
VKLNLNSEVKTKDNVKTEEIVKTEDPVIDTVVSANFVNFEDKTPANWVIVPLEDDQITARNNTTGETFTGTIAEFSLNLKG